ncbi:MAG TPA: uroporphyrinogen decarboxylase family protein [Thermoguttaceae bacterium]|nr:uroporphyrinogen decarboxylase family protein [Thermoguttaceae bacterium]
MNSRDRILAVIEGRPVDHTPLLFWCFGFPAPPGMQWQTNGQPVPFWYTKRLEHIHTLPHPWELADEFQRAEAWLSLGVDDLLEVSVPWGMAPEIRYHDQRLPPGASGGDPRYPVLVREYETPSGRLRHAVRQTGPEPEGWPVQPDYVPLFEDYNVPRAIQHAVRSPKHVPMIRHLYRPPDQLQQGWFLKRVAQMRPFALERGLAVQAWSAFGMDAAVWLTGPEGAVMLALDAPEAFRELMETIAETDYVRTELAAAAEGVDIVCQRGWYSSTDFWSPKLFDEYVYPYTAELAALVHRYGKKFGYVVTTGLAKIGQRLADAGVDLLYYIDPVMDKISLETARELFGGRTTVVGGTSAVSLASGQPERIRREVRSALDILGPTGRFILSATDALFPDTPWEGVRQMIDVWKESW